MGRYIVKSHGHYAEWSTVVDAPVTYFMSREEFGVYYRQQYGAEGFRGLRERMDRADSPAACSALDGETWAQLCAWNRAGPNETSIGAAGIWKRYGPEREAPHGDEGRG